MPAKSGKQLRLMMAAASGKSNGVGPSPEVAKEFIRKTSEKTKKKLLRGKKSDGK